ncbi:hypothetical protein A2215_00335 [Candidatus Berkelbacteria bacterium RIFOXYA2_FULL_43_10]|uniref:Uncharacterized protein n=1 Tax=Candidatus Berkelbacteria bacterium RIFOXYA2_FULL_43_10 TaxID=1797472 RepID=A0A1F5ECD2_9BACT|nr:MAG: hypothetical protein A2215_00335 [Candidatus Berkelbacteria bacterium RIFOXYA2_FULL_43_10]
MVRAEMEKLKQEKKQESDKMSERDIAMSPPQPTPPAKNTGTDDVSPLRPFNPVGSSQPPAQTATTPPMQNVVPNQSNTPSPALPQQPASLGLTKEEAKQVTDPNINQDYGW